MQSDWAGEPIYRLMTDDAADHKRCADAARRIEEQIRLDSLQPGDCLGKERLLAARTGVGRSVIREAIRILERRGLGFMRPGPRGGFIVARPAVEHVSRVVADHFQLCGLTMRQLWDARAVVDCLAVRLASESRAAEAQNALAVSEPGSALSDQLRFRAKIAELTRNAAVVLMVECLNHLTLDFIEDAGPVAQRDELQARELSGRTLAAIRSGDGSAAAAATEAATEMVERRASWAPDTRTRDRRAHVAWRATRTRAAELADRLAAEIAASPRACERLGSESELCERFGADRLVVRQAIRILQDTGVAETRRGRGRGLRGLGPEPGSTIRLVGGYLLAAGADLECAKLVCHLNIWMPALAARCATSEQQRQLQELFATLRSSKHVDVTTYLRLLRRLGFLAGNPILDTFSRCLIAYDARVRTVHPRQLPTKNIAQYLALCQDLIADSTLRSTHGIARAKAHSCEFMVEFSRQELM